MLSLALLGPAAPLLLLPPNRHPPRRHHHQVALLRNGANAVDRAGQAVPFAPLVQRVKPPTHITHNVSERECKPVFMM